MIKTAVGKSNKVNAFESGVEACQQALKGVNNQANLIIVFACPVSDQQKMLAGVKSIAKDIPLVGCSTSGEITNQGPLSRNVVVMALSTDQINFTIGLGQGADKDSFLAGQKAAEQIKQKSKKRISLLMMIMDGLAENGAAAVRGLQQVFGKNFPIIGGSAGDNFAFKKTYQYINEQVLSNTVIAVGFSGDFYFGVGVKHGWQPIGLPMKVTKAQGSKLVTINQRPALSIYEDYFGKKAEELIKEPIAKMAYSYPLGMDVQGSNEFLIRNALIANEKGEIICTAEIPEGSDIRLMLGDQEKAIEAAKEAAKNAKSYLRNCPAKAIFVFDCVARKKLLSSRIKEEISAIQQVLGQNVPLIGFYTYGEQAPLAGTLGAKCFSVFHSETIALFVLGEVEK